jgi:hypothetical protein
MVVGEIPETTKFSAAAKPEVNNKTKMQSRARVFMTVDMLQNYYN